MPQFFTPLTEPLGALWCLIVLAVVWLSWRRRWHRAVWLGLPTVLLFLLGSTPLAEHLAGREERSWAESSQLGNSKFKIQKYDAVVALGGGERVSQYDLLGFAMSDGGSRVLTAIQLVRSGRARTLVLGGSWPLAGNGNGVSMGVVQDWVANWRLVGGAVTNLGVCINTHDEAIAFRKLAHSQGWTNVLLVTSALHLRRAVAVFKQQGIEVTPVAADFQVAGVSEDLSFSLFPRQGRLCLLSLYLHEKIGWWVYRARGWV